MASLPPGITTVSLVCAIIPVQLATTIVRNVSCPLGSAAHADAATLDTRFEVLMQGTLIKNCASLCSCVFFGFFSAFLIAQLFVVSDSAVTLDEVWYTPQGQIYWNPPDGPGRCNTTCNTVRHWVISTTVTPDYRREYYVLKPRSLQQLCKQPQWRVQPVGWCYNNSVSISR